jgi:transcriptional regulator with XRE-family HTH domain
VIDRNFRPITRRASTQAQGLRHGDNATELASGLVDDRISFTHSPVYSTAKRRGQAPLYPVSGTLDSQSGMAYSLGAKMRSARQLAGKTQDQVADHLDITKGAVSQWENDQTVPELEYFRGYCLFVGASADEILLEHGMDPLLRQLVGIWDQLSPDARDSLIGNANRLLVEEKPEPGAHNPYGGHTPPKRTRPGNGGKPAKRHRE